ncbi:MAG TPA: glycosyltransferase family 2 protein [Thermoanaerobaculia bacterium]|nr:glycosyltransferase family 2 protein [Thermoanaerobaculia bacterium]
MTLPAAATVVLAAVFAGCFAACVYLYFGYPALIWLVARSRPRPLRPAPGAEPPTLSVIVPAFDEEAVIGEKLANTLAADYPPERLEVLVASDGSTDGTEAIVARHAAADRRVRLLALPRRGKAAALDAAAAAARGDVLVLTDANALVEPDAFARLAAPFADPAVGGVCGRKRYRLGRGADATELGENLYWRYDQWIKERESRAGSVFAADGTLYALRRSLYVPIADPAQADDIALSARVVLQGRRLLFEPGAVAWEEAPADGRAELARKVRVTNHSVRALWSLGRPLWTSGFYSLELLSHKLFRHLVPFLLLPMLASHLLLAAGAPGTVGAAARWLLVPHLGFYALAAAGYLLRGRPAGRRRPLSVPYYFTLVNTAALLGVLSILAGRRLRAWTPRSGGEASKGSLP